jgi:flagellar biogenesis protein FliO
MTQESYTEESGWSLIIVQLLLCISFIIGAVWLYVNMRLKRVPAFKKYKYEEGILETPYILMNKVL